MNDNPKVIAETEHYVIFHFPLDAFYGGQDCKKEKWRDHMLKVCEQIRKAGYRPIFYENRQNGFVCEKSEAQIKAWKDKEKKSAKAA